MRSIRQQLCYRKDNPLHRHVFQLHLRSGFTDFASVEHNLQRFADLGLAIYITEFDVALDSPDTVEQQAAIYARILEICLAQPRCEAM